MTQTYHATTPWHHLRTIDAGILDHLAYLSRIRRRESPSGAAYAIPSRRWLAERLGVSVGTISRHTTRLAKLGYLTKRQRRPLNGKWQTNIYVLIGRASHLVARSMQALRATTDRVRFRAHKPPSEREGCPPDRGRAALQQIIRRLTATPKGG